MIFNHLATLGGVPTFGEFHLFQFVLGKANIDPITTISKSQIRKCFLMCYCCLLVFGSKSLGGLFFLIPWKMTPGSLTRWNFSHGNPSLVDSASALANCCCSTESDSMASLKSLGVGMVDSLGCHGVPSPGWWIIDEQKKSAKKHLQRNDGYAVYII